MAVLLGVGGFFVGLTTGDDSAQVADLEASLSQTARQRDQETQRAADLSEELDELDARVEELQEEGASQSPGGAPDDESSDDVVATAPAQRSLGKPARVGEVTITPTAFSVQGSVGQSKTYLAVVTVLNRGSDDVSPFCGDAGGEVVDDKGRVFDSKSVLDDNSDNCEDIQPGLSASNMKVSFTMPANARPRILRLWGDSDEQFAQEWTLKGVI